MDIFGDIKLRHQKLGFHVQMRHCFNVQFTKHLSIDLGSIFICKINLSFFGYCMNIDSVKYLFRCVVLPQMSKNSLGTNKIVCLLFVVLCFCDLVQNISTGDTNLSIYLLSRYYHINSAMLHITFSSKVK